VTVDVLAEVEFCINDAPASLLTELTEEPPPPQAKSIKVKADITMTVKILFIV